MGKKADIKELLEQEKQLRFDRFTNTDGIDLGLVLLELARSKNKPIAIDVTVGDQQVFHAAMPGTSPDNDQWIRRKNNVVRRFHRSTLRMAIELDSKNTTLEDRFGLDPEDYVAAGGAFPISLKNAGVIGSVTVSGLTQKEDHAFVVSGIESYFQRVRQAKQNATNQDQGNREETK